jgi:hypothetical protein
MFNPIFALYSNAALIRENKAFDKDGNEIAIDQDLVDDYIAKNSYKDKRQAEYPAFQDYLDGLVKGDQEQIQTYIDACKAVKAKYPKP